MKAHLSNTENKPPSKGLIVETQIEEKYIAAEHASGDVVSGFKSVSALKSLFDSPSQKAESGKSQAIRSTVKLDKNSFPDCCICLEKGAKLALTCSHSFHVECLTSQINSNANANFLLNYNHLNCAVCRTPMQITSLKKGSVEYTKFKALEKTLTSAIKNKIEFETLVCNTAAEQKSFPEHEPGTEEFKKQALEKLSFCRCFKCKKVYYAGLKDCARDIQIEDKDLKCSACTFAEANATKIGNHKCELHGHEFAVYKCDSCCNVATHDCVSNKFCKRCHGIAYQPKNFPCSGSQDCPLGLFHPENKPAAHGTGNFASFVIGCNQCIAGEADLGPMNSL